MTTKIFRYNISGFVEELLPLPEETHGHTCAVLPSTGVRLDLDQPLKPLGRVPLPNWMIFWKSAKGGGIIFNPKIYVADFGNFKEGILIMKLI